MMIPPIMLRIAIMVTPVGRLTVLDANYRSERFTCIWILRILVGPASHNNWQPSAHDIHSSGEAALSQSQAFRGVCYSRTQQQDTWPARIMSARTRQTKAPIPSPQTAFLMIQG
jgi:hypothetical protein